MTPASTTLAAVAALVVLGASAPGGTDRGCRGAREVDVTLVRGGPHCGGEGTAPSARLLSSRAELEEAFRSELAPDLPALDFGREAVVLVSAGRRPTAGHAVELAAPKAAARGGVAALQVRVTRPEPTALVAQVVTSPCAVVRLPRAGLSELKVLAGDEAIASIPLR